MTAARRQKTVVAVSLAILALVLGLFGYALERTNRNERADARDSFLERARVTAALTESIFASSATARSDELSKAMGAERIDQAALDRRVRREGLVFAAVVDERSRLLAASTDASQPLLARAAGDRAVSRALDGSQYALSGYVNAEGPDTVLYVVPFKGPRGDRAYISGLQISALTGILGAYLARIPEATETSAYVVDASGLVIASPVRDQGSGTEVRAEGVRRALGREVEEATYATDAGERALAAAPVAGSEWRVVLTLATEKLFEGISSTLEWLILLALALAGCAAVWALSRATRDAARAEAASLRLEVANVELSRSNSELEQFASIASHDLQEPLRKVQTFGDQLERRYGEAIPEEGLDYLRRMRNAAGRMSILIEDLLRFSRVTTRALPPEPVDLSRIAAEVLSDLEAAVAEAGGTVLIDELPTLEAEPLQMRQLLQNLMGNALKFHRPEEQPEVRVERIPDRDGQVGFAVSDNGIGIEPEYRDRIFRVFERLHPRDVYAGTGIGLALCKKIVERHGGTITAEDAQGGGTRFVVMMPAAQPGSTQDGRSAPPEQTREPVGANA